MLGKLFIDYLTKTIVFLRIRMNEERFGKHTGDIYSPFFGNKIRG
jgi:hypothetical protein